MSKKSNKKQITLTNYELENIQYDLDYYAIELENDIGYYLGYVKPTRMQKIRGKKETFFVIKVDKKGYKVQAKHKNPKLAEFSFYNAPHMDYLKDSFKVLDYKSNGKNVMNKNVNKRRLTKRERFEKDPVLKYIYHADLRPDDTDSELTLAAKRSLAQVRPKDLEVQIIGVEEMT